jgi:hypothetical protein
VLVYRPPSSSLESSIYTFGELVGYECYLLAKIHGLDRRRTDLDHVESILEAACKFTNGSIVGEKREREAWQKSCANTDRGPNTERNRLGTPAMRGTHGERQPRSGNGRYCYPASRHQGLEQQLVKH